MARYRKRKSKKSYTMSERNSFKKGYWKGFFIGRKSKKKRNNLRRKKNNYIKPIKKGAYNTHGFVDDALIDDLHGGVVFISEDLN